ncbi:hypothetical protein [Hyphomicrobium sp.]|uniref:hypothetical protein n=1 Tax=Hyphomicrobium sp. TaxID=82 RepID=UPI003F71FEE8
MEVSREFKTLVRRLNEAELPRPFDEQEWLRSVVDGLEPSIRQGASEFVGRIVAAELEPADLQVLLDDAGSEYYVKEDGIRELFKILMAVL